MNPKTVWNITANWKMLARDNANNKNKNNMSNQADTFHIKSKVWKTFGFENKAGKLEV